MLSKTILDKLVPLQTEDEAVEQIKAELDAEGFPVSFYKSGGIFYTLLRIFVRTKLELLLLIRNILGNVFVSSADNLDWLEVKAADYSKRLKQAVKTQGNITLRRYDSSGPLKIAKGCVFKTEPDSSGDELRYFSTKDVFFESGERVCLVPVEAEAAGSTYNLAAGKITRCLIHLEKVTDITNADDWITREGADTEQLESLRSRTLNSFADLATRPTRDKFKSACEAVEGVLYVNIDDLHPRGQGSIDIYVASSAGGATEALLEAVRAAADTVAGPYDNILVKSAETVRQDISGTILIPQDISDDGVAEAAERIIRAMFEISTTRALNEFYISDIIFALKAEIKAAKSVRIAEPAGDVILSANKILVLGEVNITVERA